MFTGLDPFFYPAGNGQLLSRAYGMNPGVGRVEPEDLPPDTTGDVGDGDRAYATAVATRKAGGRRGHGVHPGIIDGWNRGLTPPAEEVEAARAVLEEWAALDARGEAEGVLPDGRIVDRYEAARAREVLEWAERSAEQDAYKAMRSEDARRREQAGDLPAGIPA
jgi:hypothetical protein